MPRALLAAGGLLLGLACQPDAPASPAPLPAPRAAPKPAPAPPPVAWPAGTDALRLLPLPVARGEARRVVYLSAGHANAPGKDGNLGVLGQVEAQTNLSTMNHLAEVLAATGRFEVVRSRQGDARPSYARRVAHAAEVGADVFIELHTDSRGDLYAYRHLDDGTWLYRADGDVGFSVLYSDRAPRAPERRDLARQLASALARAGFPAYPGCHYEGLYDHGPVPGSFIDRRGLFMLRRPAMPSVIIETHNAKDLEASRRWTEPITYDVFARAVAVALSELLY